MRASCWHPCLYLLCLPCCLKESTAVEKGYAEYLGKKYNNISEDIFWIAIGLGGLIGGAYLLVHSAVYIARVIGISELVICLTVIAVSNSLPELCCCDTKRIRSQRWERTWQQYF